MKLNSGMNMFLSFMIKFLRADEFSGRELCEVFPSHSMRREKGMWEGLLSILIIPEFAVHPAVDN